MVGNYLNETNMNRVIFLSIMAVMLMFITACEDSRDNYMVASKIGFVNPGYSEFNVYKGMDVTSTQLYVIKSGNGQQSAKVSVSVKDAVLDKYNEENGTAFQSLPSSCYTFVQKDIDFGGADYRKAFEIDWNEEQLIALNPDSYALPIEIKADNQKLMATDRANAIIVLNVKDAVLEVETPGLYDLPLKPYIGDMSDKEITLKVRTTFVNKSGLTYRLEVDPQLLADYNAANGTTYQLLPPVAYTLDTEWSVPANQNEGSFKLVYHGNGLNPDANTYNLGDYIVPIRIVSVSSADGTVKPSPDAGYVLYPVLFRIFELNRESTWEMIGHNNSYFDEGGGGWYALRGPELMIDNDPSTFWMSTWSAGIGSGLPYYITFDMKNEFTVYEIGLTVPTGNEWRAYQKAGYVEISQDNENWDKLLDYTAIEGMNLRVKAASPKKGRYIRLWITASYSGASSRAAIGEFDAWGQ
jgi:hypothetical protein